MAPPRDETTSQIRAQEKQIILDIADAVDSAIEQHRAEDFEFFEGVVCTVIVMIPRMSEQLRLLTTRSLSAIFKRFGLCRVCVSTSETTLQNPSWMVVHVSMSLEKL